MATTANRANRYPAGTDAANVPLDIQNLALDLDNVANIYSGTLGARPAATAAAGHGVGNPGSIYIATDTDQAFLSLAGSWREIPIGAVGAAAPIITADLNDSSVTNPKIGDSAVNSRKLAPTTGGTTVNGPNLGSNTEGTVASFTVTPAVPGVLLLWVAGNFSVTNPNHSNWVRLYLDSVLQTTFPGTTPYAGGSGPQPPMAFCIRYLLTAATHTIAINHLMTAWVTGAAVFNMSYNWILHSQ